MVVESAQKRGSQMKIKDAVKKTRILVIDDETTIRETFQRCLESHFPEYEISFAANGAEGIDIFGVEPHDVIILDLKMPIMDGRKTFHEIEMICEDRSIDMPSVILCTGYMPSDEERALVEKNASCSLLLKPVNAETLAKAVENALG